jgi:glycosyltransferase involved in cell wall biosynthesis
MTGERGSLLCVANFPTNAGYAWEFIEGLYAGIADDLARYGVATRVAYPRVDGAPGPLAGSAAEPIELRVDLGSPLGLVRALRAVRRLRVRALYLTDRAAWHPAYALLRLAGVRRIVVHDHTSGERTPPTGVKRVVKRLLRRVRPALADVVIGVSGFVGRRKVEVDLVDPDRVRVILNSVRIPGAVDREGLRQAYGIPAERPVVAAASRAAEYKGVQHLMRAFDRMVTRGRLEPPPVLVYFGDGPYLPTLSRLRESLDARDDIVLAGYRDGAGELLGGADLCVVPSTWEEAFGLAALEPGARGVAVVASRVGGIPEVVIDGETGLLVPPGDVVALADAMQSLLLDDERRRAMGQRAERRARERFSRGRQIDEMRELFRSLLGVRS